MRLLVTLLCLAAASPAAAQSLTVLSSNATRALIEELGPHFEKISGVTLTPRFDNSAALRQRIDNGEAFDVAIMTAPLVGELAAAQPGPALVQGQTNADRLPPIPADQRTAAQREAVEAFRVARGTEVSGPFHPLLRSPELMTRTRAMGDYLRYKSALPPRLSEFVILMTAREWTQQYEWNAHYQIALKAGLKPEIANAIAERQRPAQMAEDEAILYDFCQELHRDKSVSDQTYAKALQAFGEQGVIDTVGISGYYTMLAMVLNTARTPAADTGSPILRPVRR